MLLLLLLSTALATDVLNSCPDGEKCIKKCCPPGEMISERGCTLGGTGLQVPNGTLVVHERLNCAMYFLEQKLDPFTIHYNGTLVINYNDGVVVTEEFCLEENNFNATYPYVCFPDDEELKMEENVLRFYSWGLFISVPFLVVTILVYACFKRLRNLHGRCILNHTSCMLLAYLGLGLLQKGYLQEELACTILGKLPLKFLLHSFYQLQILKNAHNFFKYRIKYVCME